MTGAELKKRIEECVVDTKQIQEIRIRSGKPIMIQIDGEEQCLRESADKRLIRELLEIFSNHSLYAYEEEIRQGFLTIEGGHRIGLVGKTVLDGNQIRTMKYISGLNIRLAHECKGSADPVVPWLYDGKRLLNTLFLSPPGAGKTTLLRDVVRQVSDGNQYGRGVSVAVVDERSEIGACFQGVPQCDLGMRTDVLDGCPKTLGMSMVLRSMNPAVIAVDEIGTRNDLEALRDALRCGCRILATVHGESVEELERKPVLREMVEEGVFERYLVLGRVPKPGTVVGIYDRNRKRLDREV